MNTSDISRALTNHTKTRAVFKGVYSSDTVPLRDRRRNTPSAYVVNLDPSHMPGSHWVVIYCTRKSKEYFDSYGLPPTIKRLKRKLGSRFKYNNRQLQSLYSTICGQYCLYYIWRRCCGDSMRQIISSFSTNTIANDLFVNLHMNNQFEMEEGLMEYNTLRRDRGTQLATPFQPWHMQR